MKRKILRLLSKIKRSKVFKIFFSCFLFITVLLSSFVISSFAADGEEFITIAPVGFSEFNGAVTAVAFPGPHSLPLQVNGDSAANILNNVIFTQYPTRVNYVNYNGIPDTPTFDIYLKCQYAQVYVNGSVYYGSPSSSPDPIFLSGVNEFSCSPVDGSFAPLGTWVYIFRIVLNSNFDYDYVFSLGFESGVSSDQAKDLWFPLGEEKGFRDGLTAQESQIIVKDAVGMTLEAPFKMLDNFVLFDPPNGEPLTLGFVFGGIIALSLFIAFLKMFAGG